MESLIQMFHRALACNDLQLALLLISQNALLGKIEHSLGVDPTEETLAHDTMLGHLIVRFPHLHGAWHSIEIPLSFTSEMMVEDETDSPS